MARDKKRGGDRQKETERKTWKQKKNNETCTIELTTDRIHIDQKRKIDFSPVY